MSGKGEGSLSTTSLFVEVLVIGIQTVGAFACALMVVLSPKTVLDAVKNTGLPDAVVGALLFALAYTFGIIADRVYVPVWGRIDTHVREQLKLPEDRYFVLQARIAQSGSDSFNELMSFHTSRLRIIRCAIVNLPLTAAAIGVMQRKHPVPFVASLAVAVVLLALCVYGYWNLCHRYYRALPHWAKSLKEEARRAKEDESGTS